MPRCKEKITWDPNIQKWHRRHCLVQINTTAWRSTKEMVWPCQGIGIRHKGSRNSSLLVQMYLRIKSLWGEELTSARLPCYNNRQCQVLILLVVGALVVMVTMVVDPYVVFTDPKVWDCKTVNIKIKGEAAPDNFTFVNLQELLTLSHPFRLVLVDTHTPILGMELGEVVLSIQFCQQSLWQLAREYISICASGKPPFYFLLLFMLLWVKKVNFQKVQTTFEKPSPPLFTYYWCSCNGQCPVNGQAHVTVTHLILCHSLPDVVAKWAEQHSSAV